jgi:hypothetical protein
MGVYRKSGIAAAFRGYDEDYLKFDGSDDDVVGMTETVEAAAGLKSPDWSTMTAFENRDSPRWKSYIEAYRKTTGRQWPPVYRVTIQIEAEALPEDEVEQYWLRHNRSE